MSSLWCCESSGECASVIRVVVGGDGCWLAIGEGDVRGVVCAGGGSGCGSTLMMASARSTWCWCMGDGGCVVCCDTGGCGVDCVGGSVCGWSLVVAASCCKKRVLLYVRPAVVPAVFRTRRKIASSARLGHRHHETRGGGMAGKEGD